MKRFFQPVKEDGSFKKPSLSSADPLLSTVGDLVSVEGIHTVEAGERERREPCKFLTWNANSLLLRMKKDLPEFSNLVQTLDPDVIAIQEVRMPAAGPKGGQKNPSELKDDTCSSREEKQVIMRVLSSPPFQNYRVWWSLSDSKYAGTALLIKNRCKPKKVSFSLDGKASKHEPDGRVILAEFESFFLLNTYVPNNGWKDDENSFQRRRKWDKRMLEFVVQLDKPLIWCGDLNVSHQDIDVSHPDFFSNAKLNGYIPPNKEDCGQPGFTLSERRRLSNILSQGKLIDAYRFIHKEQDMERGFSWSGNPVGKYRGKRMRIDYFIVSEKLKDKIISCDMHGHGIELEGFCGSDHCPVSLELSQLT
ncbi:DNA-(apurinic or apyrimidinic site) lyase isoform X1 [Dendrobium catenatum]|uniref:DNA-(apurinic or apyrimidinic site) lyase isoform X1 n=1 Tax=Dendrobium catenatum TaxID=906689 RepID=UPI0010A00CC1|nr:DNA-(apurinic or apyrimidinic site) lyase isoform X1 [Dendrobium catenatum]